MNMGKPARVLCIAPAWNEEHRIGPVVQAVPRDVVDEVVIVDDGSTDSTRERAASAGATVLAQGQNRGVGAAIRRGIDHALSGGFDVAVIISGSGKTPPEQIPKLLAALTEQNAELAQGSRYASGSAFGGMPLLRRVGTRGYSFLFSLFAGRRVTDASSGFRAIRLSLFEDRRIDLWQPWLDTYELEPYLLYQAIRLGHKVVEVPVTIWYPPPVAGRSYTKMRAWIDWYRIFRPVLLLFLGWKR